MSASFAKFFSATSRISSLPIDHTHGWASIVDGDIIYSPNCDRLLTRPLMDCDIEWLLNNGQSVDRLHRPLWWSLQTAFLAFLPIYHDFVGVPFEEFNNPELQENISGFFIPQSTLFKWKQTESLLRDLMESFTSAYNIPNVKLWRPLSALVPSGLYKYRTLFWILSRYSKGWLSLYMAIFAYFIAVAQEIDEDDSDDDAMPTWFITMNKYDQALLSGLRSSSPFTYLAERVGTLLNIAEPPVNQFSVDFLIKYCVPVWYPWGPKEIWKAKHDRSFDRLAPPPDQLQRATQFLVRDPFPQPKDADRPWVAFFEKRQKHVEFLTRSETPRNRQSRLDRERNPPTVKTKVFEWSCGSDGKFTRQLVCKRENEETLCRYRASKKVYNSFWNEWDCCHRLAEPTATEMEEADWFDSDDDLDLPEAPIVPLQTSPSQNTSGNPDADLQTASPSLPTVTDLGSLEAPTVPVPSSPLPSTDPPPTRWVPRFRAPDRAHTYDVETYPATEILHHFFGFVSPIPVPRRHPHPSTLTEKDFRLFAAIINEVDLDEDFRNSTIMQFCHDFVKGLGQNRTPPNELFDLAIGNPMSIRGGDRIRSLRRRGSDISLVLPAGSANAPWDLTVTNSIDALFLCRLERSMSEMELCHALIQQGIQFRTLLPISATSSPIPPMILSVRGAGYVFTATDYDAYVQERAALLRSARLRRAALMTGGIIWCLVVSEVSFSEVLHGPTTATTIHGRGFFLPSGNPSYAFCDDMLTKSEAEAICGRVNCYTGAQFFFIYPYAYIYLL